MKIAVFFLLRSQLAVQEKVGNRLELCLLFFKKELIMSFLTTDMNSHILRLHKLPQTTRF